MKYTMLIGLTLTFALLHLTLASAEVLRLDKNSFNPGENIQVYFEASGNFDRSAWVGIIPSNVAHGSEAENDNYDLTYQYLEKRTSGTLTFKALKIQDLTIFGCLIQITMAGKSHQLLFR